VCGDNDEDVAMDHTAVEKTRALVTQAKKMKEKNKKKQKSQ
jgi:hypothetical protein